MKKVSRLIVMVCALILIVSTIANSEILLGKEIKLNDHLFVFRDLSVLYDSLAHAIIDDQPAINSLILNGYIVRVPKGRVVLPIMQSKEVIGLYVEGLHGIWFTLSEYLDVR
jgi:hypothetical protein